MKEFEQSSDVWNRYERVRYKFEAWILEWRSSSQVCVLESEMEEFEQSSKLVIGNGGVRAKFRRLESEMEEFETSSMLGIGN